MNKFGHILILDLATSSCLSCPDSWIAMGESCYKVSPDSVNWFQAQEYCYLNGGYLAEIKDEDEQASLHSFLTTDIWYWIGLADFANENSFKWQTDYSETEFTFWYEDQPDDVNGGHEDGQDCVMLGDNFEWWDKYCYSHDDNGGTVFMHGLCEMENTD